MQICFLKINSSLNVTKYRHKFDIYLVQLLPLMKIKMQDKQWRCTKHDLKACKLIVLSQRISLWSKQVFSDVRLLLFVLHVVLTGCIRVLLLRAIQVIIIKEVNPDFFQTEYCLQRIWKKSVTSLFSANVTLTNCRIDPSVRSTNTPSWRHAYCQGDTSPLWISGKRFVPYSEGPRYDSNATESSSTPFYFIFLML